MAGRNDYPVIDKTYDLVKWSCHHLARFPRAHRFTLGERLECKLYQVLEGLVQARYTRERAPILEAINLDLELLRFQFRLAHDLRCLSTDSMGFAVRELHDIGTMVGGWLRSSQPR